MARYGRNRGNPLITLGIFLVAALIYLVATVFGPAYNAKRDKGGVSDADFTTESQSQADFPITKGYGGEVNFPETESSYSLPETENAYSVPETKDASSVAPSYTYALNTNTMRIHKPNCSSVYEMAPHNRSYTSKSIEELQAEGYVKCKRCFVSDK